MTNYMDIGDFGDWLRHGERGISSEAIVSALTGVPIGRDYGFGSAPADPSDYRRCELMLRNVEKINPEVRAHFRAAMPAVSDTWARLVEQWDEIRRLIEADVPGAFEGNANGSATRAYNLMQDARFPKKAGV